MSFHICLNMPNIDIAEYRRKGEAGGDYMFSEEKRTSLRLWLQLAMTVLPMEREINKQFSARFKQSLPRFDVLAHLERAGEKGLPVGQLAARMITASSGNIASLLNRMEEEGLVMRREDFDDRRSYRVCMTEKGFELFWNMAPYHADWVTDQFTALGDGEKQALTALLHKLRAGGAQTSSDAAPENAKGDWVWMERDSSS